MEDKLLPIVVFSVVITALMLTIKTKNQELSMLIGVGSVIAVLVLCVPYLQMISEKVRILSDSRFSEGFSVIFKSVGIAVCTEIGSDTCKDAGNIALASQVELYGKLSIIAAAMPIFESFIGIVSELAV